MTEEETNPVLERIRKLLNKAEAEGVTPQEAEALTAKAWELASRYEISRALIRQRGSDKSDRIISRRFSVGRPFLQQEILCSIIYKACGCKLISISGGRENRGLVDATGFASDMQMAEIMHTSILLQAQREALNGYKEYLRSFKPWSCRECGESEFTPDRLDRGYYHCNECGEEFYSRGEPRTEPERRSTWYRSFWSEYGGVINTRIAAKKSRAQEAQQATERKEKTDKEQGMEVAISNRDELIGQAVSRRFGKVTTGRRSRQPSGSGGAAGRAAGHRADLGGEKLGGKSARSLPAGE